MSIFKSTLDPAIAAQLKARESVVSQWGDSKEVDATKKAFRYLSVLGSIIESNKKASFNHELNEILVH